MRINDDDIRCLGKLVTDTSAHPDAAIPEFNRSRLCALELIEYDRDGVRLTQRGKALLGSVAVREPLAA
jgi:hypothetical protein